MEQGFGPDQLVSCYRRGIFPMSDDRDDDTLFLVDPKARGIIPLEDLHISRSMQKFRRKTPFHVTFNRAFPEVISACAEHRDTTWISYGIEALYTILHQRTNASKLALIHLVERLNQRGFTLLDTQFLTPHLATLGAIEIPRDDYMERLAAALKVEAKFD